MHIHIQADIVLVSENTFSTKILGNQDVSLPSFYFTRNMNNSTVSSSISKVLKWLKQNKSRYKKKNRAIFFG